jgi:outer membrane immunogenic protein
MTLNALAVVGMLLSEVGGTPMGRIPSLAVAASLFAAPAVAAFAAPAVATDLAVKEPVYTKAPVVMPFNWTGFYIGAQGGFAWGQSEQYSPFNSLTGLFNTHGGFGGGTVGYNWQIANWVLGLEGDFSGSDIKGASAGSPTFSCVQACVSEVKWFGTARARLGYAYDTWLFYGTGGAAFGRIHTFFADTIVGNTSLDGRNDRAGWTAGAGIEHAFAPHWSVKLEYLHVDLGSDIQWININGMSFLTRERFDVIRGGINYRF